jgi:putative ABC transport system substrate-binding protein
VRRREILGLVAAVAAWPLTARAQADRIRRIGVLISVGEKLSGGPISRREVFRQALRDLGQIEGRNVQIDYRWGGGVTCGAISFRISSHLLAIENSN